ncbi:MAG: hypothetical protein NTU49_06875, partial [Gammaproteobacteria bacterium]|nr:hypothetical protein [Gammaproteobacteria bacterium]
GFSYLEEACCEEKKLPLSLNGMIIFGKPSDEFYVYGKPRKIEDVLDFKGADLSNVDFRGKYDLLARITQKYEVTVTQSQLDEAKKFLPSDVQYEAVKEFNNNPERLKSPTRSQSSMFGKIEKSTDNNNADWDYKPKNQ